MGILLCKHADDVMFCGRHAHFGTQKNYVYGTKDVYANKRTLLEDK